MSDDGTKYGHLIDDDHWEEDESDAPIRWREETSVDIEIDVQLHREGYQEDRKWTVHCTDRMTDDHWPDGTVIAGFGVEHRNKGNYWREGEMWGDAIDFVDLPLRVRRRVAAVLNRDLDEITPDERSIHRDDGTGIADGGDRDA